MTNISTETKRLKLNTPVLGRQIEWPYYIQVSKHYYSTKGVNEGGLWAFASAAAIKSMESGGPIRSIGFTGTQIPSTSGFCITHLVAQCARAIGLCIISGYAYGVDMAAVIGALSHDEFPYNQVYNHHSPIRHDHLGDRIRKESHRRRLGKKR